MDSQAVEGKQSRGGAEDPTTEVRRIKKRIHFGPGLLVTAAFIGPGTVVTASKAGASFGPSLLWTILFASVAATVLQMFAARLGIITRNGLGEYLRHWLGRSLWFKPVAALIIAAIGIGNAAYQTGNLIGASVGAVSLFGGESVGWVAGLACTTLVIMTFGNYLWLQRILIALVVFLSLSFLFTAAFCLNSPMGIARGFLVPSVTAESLTTVLALIGTTIVPYNLFLHSSSAAVTWKDCDLPRALRESNWDTLLSIALGGLVTAAILITASTVFYEQQRELKNISEIAQQLSPVLGRFSSWAFAAGIFAAGFTSAITAPLATAYAVTGVMGWQVSISSWRFRGIAFSVVLIGAIFAVIYGAAPGQTILLAQVANGFLLPIIAAVLYLSAIKLSREVRVSFQQKMLGALVVTTVTVLAAWKLLQLAASWLGASE